MTLVGCGEFCEHKRMKIEVKCFATLAKFAPEGGVFEAKDGAVAGDVIAALGMAPGDVKIIFVNGAHAQPDHELAEGDRVGLFPAVGGG